ncbi:hypothetical protein N7475_006394 [Penicillium sp. IBT 31633x]|nr:hypothetical protein N7475_006394 [Penicillium sp. IBT 31633x]
MAKVSILSLPNELLYEIVLNMSVRDIIVLLECYPGISRPLIWHCRHQRKKCEHQKGLVSCAEAGDLCGVRIMLSMKASIEDIMDDHENEGGACQCSGQKIHWSRSPLERAVENGHEEIVDALIEDLTQVKARIPSLKVDSVRRALDHVAGRGYFAMTKTLLNLGSGAKRTYKYYDDILRYTLRGENWQNDTICTCAERDDCTGSRKTTKINYYAIVKLLLDYGANPNLGKHSDGSYYTTPLDLALRKCSSISNGVVKLLIERGADVSDALSAFIEASNRCVYAHEDVAKLLINSGADLDTVDRLGRTCLHKVDKKGLIKVFIARGVSPNRGDYRYKKPLQALACKKPSENRIELMKQLLDLGANVNSQPLFGMTPLESVISYFPKSTKYDSDGFEYDGLDSRGNPIIEIEPQPSDYETCFPFVCKTAMMLLDYGGDANIRNADEQTPLYETDSSCLVKLLLTYAAEVNVVDSYGQTPLHAMTYGASKNMVGTIELLLKHGADTAAKNADDNTPLHLAVLTSAWEVVKLLVAYGADLNSRNADGMAPLDLLARRRSHQKEFCFNRDKKFDRLITYRVQRSWFWRGSDAPAGIEDNRPGRSARYQ